MTPNGQVTTVAGSPPGGDADGTRTAVGLRWPTGIAVRHDGGLWVADHGNGVLRQIEPTGASTTHLRLAGRRWPVAVAVGPDGTVTVAVASLEDPRRPEACLLRYEAEP